MHRRTACKVILSLQTAADFLTMNILTAENISKSYGDSDLFGGLSFGISQGQKTALIAKNGTGKTTLLRILAGREDADVGKITTRNDLQIAFLEQDPQFDENASILDIILASEHPHAIALRNYEQALLALQNHSADESQKKLDDSITQMDSLSAWDYEARMAEIMHKLGLDDLSAKVKTLSGGQRKKLALAQTLLTPAGFVILDEPTNHLDISMTEWLESYLSRQKQSLLMVSHDRYFIDAVCNQIVELDQGKLYFYEGNYAEYLEKKELRVIQQEAELEKNLNTYRSELEWMRRMPQARTTKSKSRIESFYELDEKVSGKQVKKGAEINLPSARLGKKILEFNYICKAYDTNNLIQDFTYTFKGGEKVGIIGKNGSGKTTLLKMIAGYVKPDKGSIVMGETLELGYFEQDGLQTTDDKRVIDLFKDKAEQISMGKSSFSVAQFLNYFGYGYHEHYKLYSKLSGGQKRKIHLLLTLIGNPNFLILDEPTNDLDIFTLNQLESFLRNFAGCIIVVSHDRYFMDRVADHLFVFEGDGKIKDFPGNYTDYLNHKREKAAMAAPAESKATPKPLKTNTSNKPTYKQIQEHKQLEKDIETGESRLAELEALMNSGTESTESIMQWADEYAVLKSEMETKTDRWLELEELIH